MKTIGPKLMCEIEKSVEKRGYVLVDAWIADEVDEYRCRYGDYLPPCNKGDVLAEMMGDDFGSEKFVENQGRCGTKT